MSHFAKIEDNLVTTVIVAEQDYWDEDLYQSDNTKGWVEL